MNSIRRISSYLAFITIGIVALTYSLQISLFFALLVIMTGVLWYRQGYKHLLALHIRFHNFLSFDFFCCSTIRYQSLANYGYAHYPGIMGFTCV